MWVFAFVSIKKANAWHRLKVPTNHYVGPSVKYSEGGEECKQEIFTIFPMPQTLRDQTVAFRTTQSRKHLIRAAAARRDTLPSEWLRTVVCEALAEEFGDSIPMGQHASPGQSDARE